MLVCDGLKGLPDAVECGVAEDGGADLHRPSPAQLVQVRVEKGLGGRSPKTSNRSTPQRPRPRRWTAFAEFSAKWEKRYPAIIRLWENAWAEFVPFLQFDVEIRTIICTTNAIESLNARFRRAVKARGHFPTEQAAMKCLYLALMSLDPTGRPQALDQPLEGRTERLRHHLRRPPQRGPEVTTKIKLHR